VDDLQCKLRSTEICNPVSKPIVLLFSGQNGDTTPSARCLYESSSIFRARLQECEEAMHHLGLPSPVSAVLAGIQSSDKTDLVLRHTTLFSLQYACGMSWIDSGITPQAICGHSFGEWAALTVSGALTLEAGMKLVAGYAIFGILSDTWANLCLVSVTNSKIDQRMSTNDSFAYKAVRLLSRSSGAPIPVAW
jgi:malonyl CoA-acyl carrier protein transacylase